MDQGGGSTGKSHRPAQKGHGCSKPWSMRCTQASECSKSITKLQAAQLFKASASIFQSAIMSKTKILCLHGAQLSADVGCLLVPSPLPTPHADLTNQIFRLQLGMNSP